MGSSERDKPDPHANLLLLISRGEHMPNCNKRCNEHGHYFPAAPVGLVGSNPDQNGGEE